jgi:alpha-galactosidase
MNLRLLMLSAALAHIWICPAARAMSATPEEFQLRDAWLTVHGLGAEAPWSFQLDGQPGAPGGTVTAQPEAADRLRYQRLWRDPHSGLEVRAELAVYRDFPTVEWTVNFKNTGTNDTPLISNIQALDTVFGRPAQGEFVLHHWAGSQATSEDYRPFATILHPKQEKHFAPNGGRGSDGVWPYFNLDHGGAGVIVAVGWPGQWAATFGRDAGTNLQVRAGQELTHFRLHPGEEARTPLIVLQFWQGGDWIRAQNIWRRWMLAHNVPRLAGHLPPPLFSASSGNQLSEMQHATEENQIQFIDGYLQHGIQLDFWWMDAGWYTFRDGWWNVGTWTVDRQRFPRGLRAVSDHAHLRGVQTLLWFEPERVTPGTWLYEHHPKWLLGRDGAQKLLDLGNAAARQWVTEHIDQLMQAEGIDIYRQDFNFPPLGYWREHDAPDRQGLTEIRHVAGYLAFWDELRRRHSGLLMDTCASGGRRNDLETLRRAVPLHKSDMEYPNLTAKQTQLAGLAFWVPYFGAPVYPAERVDAYGFRSAFAPMTGAGFDTRRADLDYALLKKLQAEWRVVVPDFFGDYYPLTAWSFAPDVWLAWQFDRPEAGCGVVQAFRRPESPYETARLQLRGLDATATYELKNFDTGKPSRMTGRELMATGLPVTLTTRPAAAVIRYQRLQE